MIRDPESEAVFVEAVARLHFGVLDLRRERGRWFGGIGAAAPAPTVLVSAAPGDRLEVDGDEAARAEVAATRFLEYYRLPRGARVRVHRALPPHAGLGSGTQLALSVARALAELHGLQADAAALARAVGRATRSAVGTWTFAGGGLVVEGGRRPDRDECGPLLARLAFPSTWRCVVVVPEGPPGVSGAEESAAFAHLPQPDTRDVERVAHLVLMTLLPALVEDDLEAFGGALTEIQETTGRWFAPVQGGTFVPGPSADIIGLLRASGAVGVGQSSWGPTVYGIVRGQEAEARLVGQVRAGLGADARIFHGPFRGEGARVWRARVSPDGLARPAVL